MQDGVCQSAPRLGYLAAAVGESELLDEADDGQGIKQIGWMNWRGGWDE
jgi:hypothetical protein